MNPIERLIAWLIRMQLRADLRWAEQRRAEAHAALPFWTRRTRELRQRIAQMERES